MTYNISFRGAPFYSLTGPVESVCAFIFLWIIDYFPCFVVFVFFFLQLVLLLSLGAHGFYSFLCGVPSWWSQYGRCHTPPPGWSLTLPVTLQARRVDADCCVSSRRNVCKLYCLSVCLSVSHCFVDILVYHHLFPIYLRIYLSI